MQPLVLCKLEPTRHIQPMLNPPCPYPILIMFGVLLFCALFAFYLTVAAVTPPNQSTHNFRRVMAKVGGPQRLAEQPYKRVALRDGVFQSVESMMDMGISPPRAPSPLRLPRKAEELTEMMSTGILAEARPDIFPLRTPLGGAGQSSPERRERACRGAGHHRRPDHVEVEEGRGEEDEELVKGRPHRGSSRRCPCGRRGAAMTKANSRNC